MTDALEPRSIPCGTCGQSFVWDGRGRAPVYCPDHRLDSQKRARGSQRTLQIVEAGHRLDQARDCIDAAALAAAIAVHGEATTAGQTVGLRQGDRQRLLPLAQELYPHLIDADRAGIAKTATVAIGLAIERTLAAIATGELPARELPNTALRLGWIHDLLAGGKSHDATEITLVLVRPEEAA